MRGARGAASLDALCRAPALRRRRRPVGADVRAAGRSGLVDDRGGAQAPGLGHRQVGPGHRLHHHGVAPRRRRELRSLREGPRHRLQLTIKAAGDNQTAVSVERAVFKRERILFVDKDEPVTDTEPDRREGRAGSDRQGAVIKTSCWSLIAGVARRRRPRPAGQGHADRRRSHRGADRGCGRHGRHARSAVRGSLLGVALQAAFFFMYLTLLSRADVSKILPMTAFDYIVVAVLAQYLARRAGHPGAAGPGSACIVRRRLPGVAHLSRAGLGAGRGGAGVVAAAPLLLSRPRCRAASTIRARGCTPRSRASCWLAGIALAAHAQRRALRRQAAAALRR